MATSSILKEFYVKDYTAYKKLQKELAYVQDLQKRAMKPSSLENGRKKLANFVFR